jgi:hypothetical protein
MRSPTRLLIVTAAVLLSAVQLAPAKTLHARSHAIPPEAAPWCLHDHAGGVACYVDFQGCMYAAAAVGGNCLLNATGGQNMATSCRRANGTCTVEFPTSVSITTTGDVSERARPLHARLTFEQESRVRGGF